ncbi:MAG: GIY-YIG nuclease family protein [Verrucomicrobiota bacterium]
MVESSSLSQPTTFMAWVYILRGAAGRHYIGSTTNFDRRIEEHRRGNTHTTRRLGGDIQIVDVLEVATAEEARDLEFQMKRKKNPQLALALLQNRRNQIVQPSSPEK